MAAVGAFDFILFGGSGDLAMRKLLPALYYRHRDSHGTEGWHVIGIGRQALSRDDYIALAFDSCRQHVTPRDFSEPAWQSFCECLDYVQLDAQVADDYARLAATLKDCDQRPSVCYLATSPSLFTGIRENIGQAGLAPPTSPSRTR